MVVYNIFVELSDSDSEVFLEYMGSFHLPSLFMYSILYFFLTFVLLLCYHTVLMCDFLLYTSDVLENLFFIWQVGSFHNSMSVV